MSNQFASVLAQDKISDFRIREALCVKKDESLQSVLKKMKVQRRGSALVEQNGKLVGIFTERDMLTRVIPQRPSQKTPIKDIMSKNPVSLNPDNTIAEVLSLMNQTGVRHIPIVLQKNKKIVGIISVRDILNYLSEHFPNEVYNLPPDLNQINRAPEGA